MNNPIVPDSASSGKSYAIPKSPRPLQTRDQLLSGWVEDTERTMNVLQAWLAQLRNWQTQEKVSRTEFEEAYAILRPAGLEEWVKPGLERLRAAVTGQESERKA